MAHIYKLLVQNGLIVPNPLIPPQGNFFTIATAIMTPSSKGFVKLNSTDPFTPPLIDPAYLTEKSDMVIMREAIRSALKFVSAPAWSDYILGPTGGLDNTTTDATLDAYIRANTGTFFHPTSTNRMSAKGAEYGVVDPDLTLKKVKGVRVVDASVFVSVQLTALAPQDLTSESAALYC